MAENDKDSQELAEDRTDWAEDRTILANERTFAGWMRTAMAAAGIGLGFQAIFRASEPTWLAKAGATIFIVLALGIIYAAWHSTRKLHKRLDSHETQPISQTNFGRISSGAAIGIASLGFILWVL